MLVFAQPFLARQVQIPQQHFLEVFVGALVVVFIVVEDSFTAHGCGGLSSKQALVFSGSDEMSDVQLHLLVSLLDEPPFR